MVGGLVKAIVQHHALACERFVPHDIPVLAHHRLRACELYQATHKVIRKLTRMLRSTRWNVPVLAHHRLREARSYVRLIDSCITQLKAQGPSRTCNESKEEEERELWMSLNTLLTRVYNTDGPSTCPYQLAFSNSTRLRLLRGDMLPASRHNAPPPPLVSHDRWSEIRAPEPAPRVRLGERHAPCPRGKPLWRDEVHPFAGACMLNNTVRQVLCDGARGTESGLRGTQT